MKTTNLLLIILLLTVNGKTYAVKSNTTENNETIKTLEECYTANAQIWSTKLEPDIFYLKCDSLYHQFCTTSFQKRANEVLSYGFDALTADEWGIDMESLKSLTITKDTTSSLANLYVVSYLMTEFPVSPSKPVKYQIKLKVSVILEDGVYKINNVEGEGNPVAADLQSAR